MCNVGNDMKVVGVHLARNNSDFTMLFEANTMFFSRVRITVKETIIFV